MAIINYSSVRVLIAVDNPLLRKGLSDALKKSGFCHVSETSLEAQARETLATETFDLVILSDEIEGTSTGPVVTAMRQGTLGPHPFPVVMTLLAEGRQDMVRRVIDAGPDDILLMPVAPTQLLARIALLTRTRKRFVVSHDYTGPDRRQNTRDSATTPLLVDVPNPLGARAEGVSSSVLGHQITIAACRLERLKLERDARQIDRLKQSILQMFRDHTVDGRLLSAHGQRLKELGRTLPRRAGRHGSPRLAELAADLAAGTDAVVAAGERADRRQLAAMASACSGLVAELTLRAPAAPMGMGAAMAR